MKYIRITTPTRWDRVCIQQYGNLGPLVRLLESNPEYLKEILSPGDLIHIPSVKKQPLTGKNLWS